MRGDKDVYHLSVGNEERMFSRENNVPAMSFLYLYVLQTISICWLLHIQGSSVGKALKASLAIVLCVLTIWGGILAHPGARGPARWEPTAQPHC